jgi:biopolymer transport protein ExbD
LEPVVVRLDIEADNRLRWNGQPLADRPALEAQLAEAAERQPQPELHIRSHAQAQYAATAAVLASAQRLGLKKLGILGTERFAGP